MAKDMTSRFGVLGGPDALVTKLYCDHKNQWVKLVVPRPSASTSTLIRVAARNKVKVEATARATPEGDNHGGSYIYVKVSDLEENND